MNPPAPVTTTPAPAPIPHAATATLWEPSGTWLRGSALQRRLLGWLWAGVQASDATTVARKTMQTNVAAMMAICAVLAYIGVFVWLGSPVFRQAAAMLLVPLVLLPMVWWLNIRRQLHAARVSVVVLVAAAIVTVCLSGVGTSVSTHSFLILVAVVTPILLDTRQRAWLVGLTLANLTLYVLLEWFQPAVDPALLAVPEGWLEWLRRSVLITSTLTVLVLIALNESAASENEHRLRELATTDALTGLSNRRHFYQTYALEAQRRLRDHAPMAVVLMDLDHFKQVNDRFGHAGGDQALRHSATIMRGLLRPYDVLARLGGEEFGLLLPRTTLDGARQIAERVREAIERAPFTAQGQIGSLTVSLGVTTVAPGMADLDAALKRADEALYKAKNSGRNRVCVAV